MTPLIGLAGLLFFAGASFFFALAESALFSLAKWQVRQLPERYPAPGALIARLLAQPQDLLATIVLGNTLANAAMVALTLWLGLRGIWPVYLATALLLILILFVCEVAPKALAVRAPEAWAVRVARPMALLQSLSTPLRLVAQRLDSFLVRIIVPKSIKPQTALSDDEYKELFELAYQHGALAEQEKEIILQIISLDRRTARDVMQPRSCMDCISDDLSREEMVEAARKFKHRRLPIYDGTPDTIVGVLNTRALLLDPDMDLADAIEFPSFVPESMNLLKLLKSIQRQQRGLAIVLDEFGGTAGIVTMEDILEAMVGEIRREGEPEPFVMEKLGDGRWRVNAAMRVEDFQREYPDLPDVAGAETMGGILLNELGVVPTPGQSTVYHGLRLTAQAADDRRIREVIVEAVRKR
jgi:putative hemolysin